MAGLADLVSISLKNMVSMKLALQPHNLAETRSKIHSVDKVTNLAGLAALISISLLKMVSMKLSRKGSKFGWPCSPRINKFVEHGINEAGLAASYP